MAGGQIRQILGLCSIYQHAVQIEGRIRSDGILRIGSLSPHFAHDESDCCGRGGPRGAKKLSQASRAVRPNWVAQIEPETVVAERAVAGMDTRRLKPSTATKNLHLVANATSYVFVQARPSEKIADWIGAHVDLFAFLGGVPKFVVCDNLKAAVTNPDRYEPGLNRSYLELADHYGAAILPARPYKPRDKAKAEQSVLLAERWVLARLRNARFFSAADLNAAIGELVRDINARPMKGFNASRAELFATLDKPALKSLPDEPYAFAVWKRCRVAPDYHIEVDGHWYSAPFRLIRELVDVRVADKTVEIFLKGQRVASHMRAPNRRGHTTLPEHMPSAHRRHASWTPARLIAYGEKVGPSVAALFEAIMTDRPHPEQGFRTCLGILALTRTYDNARVDAACRRGVSIKARSVASIRSILKNGLDRAFLNETEDGDREPVRHGNIRGGHYYH